MEIDRHQLAVREPIKTVGEHRVTVHLHAGVDAEVVVAVSPER
jgi:ribosomal protein L9